MRVKWSVSDAIEAAAVPFCDYELNALPTSDRTREAGLVWIAGGTHGGIDQVAAGVMRLLGNPDRVACRLAGANPNPAPENLCDGRFGTPEQRLLEVVGYPPACVKRFERATVAGRQQMRTAPVARAFFERSPEAQIGKSAPYRKPGIALVFAIRPSGSAGGVRRR